MVTIRIKDTRSKQAQAIIALLKTFRFAEVFEEETHYDPEFVDKIKKSGI